MSSKKYNPMEQIKGILGEHCTSYVVFAVTPDAPNTLQMRTDNRYAALGMITRGLDILNENIVDEGWEIVWDNDDEEDET
tara:strand:+ start:1001 stop:1240 length:240 start_codon:yes stop_codon:yes gene_type:complete